jgi:sensor c-di-GMP phosphodiesterase-like protein
MKRILKQRLAVTLCATISMVACGALAGYLVGRAITLQQAAVRLGFEAERAIGESVVYSRDAHAALDAMNASHSPYCSEEDMEFLRNLLYHSLLLKEIGRIHDNRIACSTMMGPGHLRNAEMPNPDSIGADEVKVYRDPPGFQLPDVMVTALQAGDSYVVLNPYPHINTLQQHSPVHIVTTVLGPVPGRPVSPTALNALPPLPLRSRDGDFRRGNVLYSTRCSLPTYTCMTASLSDSEALQFDQVQLRANVIFGGMGGGLLGFLVSLAYRRRHGMEHQLRRAIRKDELRLVYQPIIDLASKRVVGAEALARWTDEEGFAVSPDVFVRIAEERGFVGAITRLVVRHAMQDFGAALRAHPNFRLSINVAAADLADPQFLPMLEESLKRAEVSAASLAIEITESSTARREVAMETIRRLHERGHSVHIDDFGTGFSGLSYLHDLAIDTIKIDKSFTQAIGTEAVTVGILPQILAMAEALKLNVIVEGVETKEQASYFAGAALPVLAQGWLFGHPVPADLFHRLLVEDEKEVQAVTAKA